MYLLEPPKPKHEPWNKGKLIGQKSPLKRRDIWTLRVKLELTPKHERGLAMFNLAIDSKLRASDLVKLKVKDISVGGKMLKRAMIIQQKTALPVQFELTKPTRDVNLYHFIGHLCIHHFISCWQYKSMSIRVKTKVFHHSQICADERISGISIRVAMSQAISLPAK